VEYDEGTVLVSGIIVLFMLVIAITFFDKSLLVVNTEYESFTNVLNDLLSVLL